MTEQKLTTFKSHLNKMMQNPDFAELYEEEKRRMKLALMISTLRTEKKFSQKELALLSGITQQQLSKLERGENCNISTFLKVCHSLGVEVTLNSIAA